MLNRKHLFVLQNLVLKDFRVRYRNMSLGVIWSLANPLLMMGLLTFVFTRVFPNPMPHFPIFALCALVPLNFFNASSNAGTTSILENHTLIKRVKCPRAIFPIAAVLSSSLHFLIQIGLLILLVLLFGHGVTFYWLWMPPIWAMLVVFMCGVALVSAALDVYYRDVRYLVECSGLIMFWLVPVFYTLDRIPARFRGFYAYNPIANVAIAARTTLMDSANPSFHFLLCLFAVSLGSLIVGFMVFERLQRDFADYL